MGFPILDLNTEACLDSSINFNRPLGQNYRHPQGIFLTGATGFLGIYLLNELLQQTTADIYCLVRSQDLETAKDRLKKDLQFYGLAGDTLNSRIIPVLGDLSQPLFGLSQQEFNQLANCIDSIYHNGSQVNFGVTYPELKGTNVLGTQEILRLGSLSYLKPVHFISSVTIFYHPAYTLQTVKETDFPRLDEGLNTGYKQSKWVAEQMIKKAQKSGLPACIYRPARIMGHSQTGIYGKFDNFFLKFIKACILMGKFPNFEVNLNIIPVDYVSAGIVYLSLQENASGKTFHFVNPQEISWTEFFECINIIGYPVQSINEDEWKVELENYANKPEIIISHLLNSAKAIGSKKPRFDASQTLIGLDDTSIVCPPLNLELISTYFSFFKKMEYLNPY